MSVLPAALADLAAETPEANIKQRPALGRGGKAVFKDGKPLILNYVDARYVQDTLDRVVGPENWQSRFEPTGGMGVRCGIGILIASGAPFANPDDSSKDMQYAEWVWKWDVGAESSIEPVKGSHSDAFKRAAVQWGIGRDLYDDREEVATEPAPTPEPAEPRQSIRQAVRASSSPAIFEGMGDDENETADENGDWECPDHGVHKVVAAGVSKKSGKHYPAFYACPVRDCNQTGPSIGDDGRILPPRR